MSADTAVEMPTDTTLTTTTAATAATDNAAADATNTAAADATETPAAPPPPACQFCGKAESELNKKLKNCGKCKLVQYCSRDCQKSDFKLHKRMCKAIVATQAASSEDTSLSGPPAPPSIEPSEEEIFQEASSGADLLAVLSASPEHRDASPEKPEPPILKHLISFVSKTMAVYWTPLLPKRKALELLARLKDDPEAFIKEGNARMEELAELGNHVDTWPPFEPQLYSDALSRNWMALMIVSDDFKQELFGMPPGEIYNWSEAVREEVRKQQGESRKQHNKKDGEKGSDESEESAKESANESDNGSEKEANNGSA